MKTIWKREWQGYFHTPVGYVFIGVFLLISSILFFLAILQQHSGDLPTFIGEMSYLWMLLCPVLTMRLLAEESGLKGLSGVSNDMRLVEREAAEGNPRAQLALETFVDGIVGYIGMFTAFLGGLDAICFTGGIGVNDPLVRKMVTERLEFVGARLEENLNATLREGRLQAPDSRIEIWAFETNEELMVARACREILKS